MWSKLLILVFGITTCQCANVVGISTIASQITELSKKGSYKGGTDLYIRGDFVTGDPSVYVIKVGSKTCEIVHFDTDDSNIHCKVPASNTNFPSTEKIEMVSKAESLSFDSSAQLTFSYDYDRTPWILYVNPSEACPGDEVSFVGRWGTTDWNLIKEAKISGLQMSLLDEVPELDYWGWYNVTGIVNDNIHGDVQATIELSDGHGISATSWLGLQYGTDGSQYNFRTSAKIDSVSYNEGSKAGGQELSIAGAGFPSDISKYEVLVDGAACELKSVSYNQIVCMTSAKGTPSVAGSQDFAGGAGLLTETWYSESSWAGLIGLVQPDLKTVSLTPQIKNNVGDNIQTRLSGLFLAPQSGSYQFFISSDDGASVYLSTDSSPNNKQLIISFNDYTDLKDKFRNPKAASSPIDLVQGQAYYLEVRHSQWGGASHFELGLEMPGSGPNKKPFIQHVKVGPSTLAREVQKIKIGGNSLPTGGQLVLKYGTSTLSPVEWNAASSSWKCSDIQAVLKTLNIGYFLCDLAVESNALVYSLTFNFAKTAARKLFAVDSSKVLPAGIPYVVSKVPGVVPVSGSFTVSFMGKTTTALSYNIWTRGLEKEINTQLAELDSQLFLKGNAGADGLDLYFILPYNAVSSPPFEFSVDATLLLGGGLEGALDTRDIQVTSEILSTPGDRVFFHTIPSEYLRTYESSPQVQVKIDNRLAVCRGNCAYVYKSAPEYPKITSITQDATSVTLNGGKFEANLGEFYVYIGFAECIILSHSSSIITFSKPISPQTSIAVAGDWKPVLIMKKTGIVESDDNSVVSIPLVITSVSPSVGSEQGGTILTITGSGFLNSIQNTNLLQSVQIGTSTCELISTSPTSIQCKTSAKTTDSVLKITLGSSSSTSDNLFTYDPSSTPEISSISPSSGSTIVKTQVTITGTGFGSTQSKVSVQLKSSDFTAECLVTSVTDSQILCNINGGPRGSYTWSIQIDPKGNAKYGSSTSQSFDLKLEITDLSVLQGSKNGGTLITVNGLGFSSDPKFMTVLIGNQDSLCNIETASSTSFTCTTPALDVKKAPEQDYEFILYGRLTDRATCPSNTCKFKWSASATPVITALNPSSGKAGDSVEVTGSNFAVDSSLNLVYFGDVKAEVLSSSSTLITVQVPKVSAASLQVSLDVQGSGLATGLLDFGNLIKVVSVSPQEISSEGGLVLIEGSGFEDSMSLAFASVACTVTQVGNERVSCEVSKYSLDEDAHGLETGAFVCDDLAVCGISFKSSKAASVTSLSGNLRLAGTFFDGVSSADVSVKLVSTAGKFACVVSEYANDHVTCVPNAPAGTYSLSVHIAGYGYAAIPAGLVYTIELSVSSAVSQDTSYAGGQVLSLSGLGLYEDLSVQVCGFNCEIISSTGSSLTCSTPELATTLSLQNFKVKSKPELLKSFTIISSSSTSKQNAFDGDITTYYKDSTNSNKFIGVDVGVNFKFLFNKIRFIGQNNYKDLVGTLLQGSDNGLDWTDVKTFVTINNLWNTWSVKPGTSVSFRYFRLFKSQASTNYGISEVEFYGVRFVDSSSVDQLCEISIPRAGLAGPLVLSEKVSYKSTFTPLISSLTPDIGTSAGGTLVSIAGTGFGDSSQVSVMIDEIECVVQSVVDSKITCVTGPRPEFSVKSLIVFVNGKGRASTQGLLFTYAERWSDPNTWGGEVPPREGESVFIPSGMNLILDTKTPLLQSILIEGSLIVEDVQGITIDSYYIFVHGGSFQIGTEEKPFLSDITITLHGNRRSPTLPNYGNKFIAVRNGVLDIHGAPRTPSWTSLDSSANAGDTFILLQEEVDWQSGEQIVIATTTYSLEESETVYIDHVDAANKKKVFLKSALKFDHYAATETYGDDTIEIRAEVGLLTRNIKIRGSDEGLDEQHGVHIMLFSPGDESVIGRIENLELFYAGQAFTLGRYPLHFHMIGTVSQSYIRNNAIHHTFNRATTVHGVYYLTIKDNVAYHTMGHTYFIEDGIESQNTIEHNLGVNTYQSFSLLNVDQTPAIFWITNPSNYIINNHAAGGQAYGFWYSMDLHPSGPSATSFVWPEFMELGQFEDNTAHSLKKYGLRIFHRFFPSASPGEPFYDINKKDWWNVPNTPIPAEFKRFTAWKCRRTGAIAEDVGDVRFIDFKIADNIVAGIEFTYTNWTQWYQTTRVVNALIIGNSGNSESACEGTIGLLTPQTDGLFIDGAKFHNFDTKMFPLGAESHSWKPPTRDFGARFVKLQKLSFTNSHKKINWGIPPTSFWEILDDTLTGTPGDYVAAYWPHLITPECTHEESTYNGVVCSGAKIRRIGFSDIYPSETFNILNISVIRVSGTGIPTETIQNPDLTTFERPFWSKIPMQKGGKNHHDPNKAWNVPFVTGHTYSVHWGNSPVDWVSFNIEQDTFEADEWVHLKLNFTDHRENFSVSRGFLPAGTVTTAVGFVDPRLATDKKADLAPSDPSGTYTWNNNSGTEAFEMIVNGLDGNDNQWGNVSIKAFRCFGDHCSTVTKTTETSVPKTTKYWSDASIWPSGLPTAGSFVEVPSDWHLFLDIDTPVLKKLEINGILEFAPDKSLNLHAQWIFIRKGSLISGNSTNPTVKSVSHNIVLHGLPLDDSFSFSPDVQGGNKVVVVTGKMALFGYPKTAFTYLEQNSYPGDDFIFVNGVDWDVGDEIVISTSGFEPDQHESFKIVEVVSPSQNFDQKKKEEVVTMIDFSNDIEWVSANGFRNCGKDKSASDPNQQAQTAISTGITKIRLDKVVEFYHSGTRLVVNGQLVDMRTEVALVSRNVKIMTEGNGWSGTVVVNDFLDELVDTDPVLRKGNVDLSHVEFDDCGQFDTNLACIRFQSVGENSSSVHHCSFKNPQTWAIYLENAKNIDLSHNLLFNSRWRGVVATNIQDVIINNNWVIRLFERNYVGSIFDAAAGFFICSSKLPSCTFTLTNNRVLGSDFTGFVVGGGECSSTSKINSGNKVRSADIGFLFTGNGDIRCIELSQITVHFCSEGIGFKGWFDEFSLTNFELVENLVGMSMKSAKGDDGINVYGSLSDSIFVGKTIHSLCLDCALDLACDQRLGYVFGLSDVGIADIVMTGKIKAPLFKQSAIANIMGTHHISNVQFMNFNINPKCTRVYDFAIASNKHAPDYQLPQFFSQVTFSNVDSNNRVYMFDPDPAWLNEEDCVDWNCTGPLNALAIDLDGSIVGGSGGYVLPNNPGIAKDDICTINSRMNAYVCVQDSSDKNYYMMMSFESQDSDKETRTIAPINVTSAVEVFDTELGNKFRNDLAQFQDHMWDGFYTGHLRLSRFPGIIYTGRYYNITNKGTLPNNLMFRLQGTQGKTEPIIVTLKYMDPAAVSVYVDNQLYPGFTWSNGIAECSFSDNHGANRWFHEENTIQFVLRNEKPVQVRKKSSVKINLELDISIEDFFDNNGATAFVDKFAAMLNIPTYRIRIVNIRAGSTIIDFYVIPDDSAGLTQTDELNELKSLKKTVEDSANDGSLSDTLGYPILDFKSEMDEVSDHATESTEDSSSNGGSGQGDDSNNESNNESNDDSAGEQSPEEENRGKNKINLHKFKTLAEDWIIAIFGGVIFIVIILSGLVLYTKAAHKTVHLHEMKGSLPVKVADGPDITPVHGWQVEVQEINH